MLASSARIKSELPGSLEKRLQLYSLASTAGLGILALAQSAQARIVYTPANVNIRQNGGLIKFDLNHDGIPDFGLSNVYFHSSFQANGSLRVVQVRSANEMWNIASKGFECAQALPKGALVGPKGRFHKDPRAGLAMAFDDLEGTYFGPWLKVKEAYLGLKFVVKGKVHFGWARVKVNTNSVSMAATLTGYAYETVPGKAIIAGKTHGPDVTVKHATLGELAAGRN